MKKAIFIFIGIISLFFSCKPKYDDCGSLLSSCRGSQKGKFCTFGYKIGENPIFSPSGLEVEAPEISGGIITFSFHTATKKISTTQKDNMTTINFDEKGDCARERVLAALAEWEKYGDFAFEQLEDNSNSIIKYIVAKDVDNNTGNPNYQDELCNDIAGNIVFNDSVIEDCHVFFMLCLHETGHVLGLGHVNNTSVMKQGSDKYRLDGLQEGDIEGIQSIYGQK